LQRQHDVPHRERERAAGSAFAEDDDDDRRAQRRHREDRARDGLGLSALLTLGTRVGAGRVDERDERKVELLREPVETDGLPVPLRMRHAEVADDVLLGRRALLLADDDDGPPIELGDAADDRGIVAEAAITVQLLEALEGRTDDVQRVRALDVARGLDRVPRARPRGELRRIGDEVGVRRQMPVRVHLLRADETIEHGHGQRLQRTSRDAARNALRKKPMRSRSCARGTIWSRKPFSKRNSALPKPAGSFSPTVPLVTRSPENRTSAPGSATMRSPRDAYDARTPPVVGSVMMLT